MEEKKSDDYSGSKKQSSSGGPLENEDLVSLASGVAREFLIERRGPSNEGKEVGVRSKVETLFLG